MEAPVPRARLKPATLLGLVLALVVPTVPPFISAYFLGPTETVARVGWGLVEHWTNFAALIAVMILLERQPLASIGFRPLRWWTIPLGLLAGVVIVPVSGALASAAGASGDAQFASFLQSLPFTTRLALVVTAGIFEETLYRGYALERLTSLFNNKWAAASVTVAVFTLAHIPAVGLAHLLPVFIVSVLITLLYLWRRDLVVNVIAHMTIDGVALLLIPIMGHHGAA